MTTQSLIIPGATAELFTDAPTTTPIITSSRGDLDWSIGADGALIRLHLRSRADLPRVAQALGGLPAIAPLSMALHLLISLLARGVPIDVPTAQVCSLLAQQMRQVDRQHGPPDDPLSDQAVASLARAVIANPEHQTLQAAGRWNMARALVELGCQLWGIRGTDALPFALTDGHDQATSMLQSLITAVAWPLVVPKLPLPVAPRTQMNDQSAIVARMDAWVDFISLAPGTGPLPEALLPDGFGLDGGAFPPSPHGELDLPHERAQLIKEVARSLRPAAARPQPRYLRQPLRVVIPRVLRPLIAPWNIHGIMVIPEIAGMWVAVYSSDPAPTAVAWWPHDSSYLPLAPKAFAPACWLAVHAICAAFWYDLLAEVITVEAEPPRRAANTADTHGRRRDQARRADRYILLPARRTTRAMPARRPLQTHWSSEAEQDAITHFTTIEPRYRPLPEGWEDRQDRSDFKRRRSQAAARAEADGWPCPEDGFTYVKRHERAVHSAHDSEPPRIAVISRGVFRTALALHGPTERVDDDEATV